MSSSPWRGKRTESKSPTYNEPMPLLDLLRYQKTSRNKSRHRLHSISVTHGLTYVNAAGETELPMLAVGTTPRSKDVRRREEVKRNKANVFWRSFVTYVPPPDRRCQVQRSKKMNESPNKQAAGSDVLWLTLSLGRARQCKISE
jgi:hypothetical protein